MEHIRSKDSIKDISSDTTSKLNALSSVENSLSQNPLLTEKAAKRNAKLISKVKVLEIVSQQHFVLKNKKQKL